MSAQSSRKNRHIFAMFALAANWAFFSMPVAAADALGSRPIKDPITGNEDLGDLSQPQQALSQFYRGFNARDLKMIDENFAHSDEVAIDNPLGGIRRGADQPHLMAPRAGRLGVRGPGRWPPCGSLRRPGHD